MAPSSVDSSGESASCPPRASDSSAPAWPRRAGRWLLRNPLRRLTVLAALAVIGLAGWLIGRQVWAAHHWRAAQSAVGHYQYRLAQQHLERCHSVWRDDRGVLLLGARIARRLQMFGDADGLLKQCRQVHGEDDDLILERVLLRAERGDLDGVSLFCSTLLDKNHPQSEAILEALVAGCLRGYRLDDAEGLIGRWQKLDPEDAHAEYSRGFLAELRANHLDAVKAYRQSIELDPEHVDARFRLASVLLDLSQAQEAVPHLRWLAERHPTYVSVLVDLARGLDQLGEQDEAERFLARAREFRPNHPETWLESGILAMRRGEYESAESWLRAACALAPGDYRSHYQLSLCLERRGKADEARAMLPRLKQLEADNARWRAIIGQLLPQAPNDPNLHYDLGMIALRADSTSEALRWFESALAADPRHEPTHQALAGHYQRSGQMARAARHLEFVKSKGDTTSR